MHVFLSSKSWNPDGQAQLKSCNGEIKHIWLQSFDQQGFITAKKEEKSYKKSKRKRGKKDSYVKVSKKFYLLQLIGGKRNQISVTSNYYQLLPIITKRNVKLLEANYNYLRRIAIMFFTKNFPTENSLYGTTIIW